MPPRSRAAVRRATSAAALSQDPVLPLVAVFAAGYLAAYLLPTVVSGLGDGLGLSAAQAGAVGSALLSASATAGIVLASQVGRIGPARLARLGLLLIAGGFALAASSSVPLSIRWGAGRCWSAPRRRRVSRRGR